MTPKPPEVSLKTRWLLYAGTWGAALLGRTFIPALLEGRIPSREAILIWTILSWLFPVGLIGWFDPSNPDKVENTPLIALIWLAYLPHGFFTLRSRTRVRFSSLLLILAIVLAFNVVGCKRTSLHIPGI